MISPPADLGALDGFVAWVYGDRPGSIAENDGPSFPFFNHWLPHWRLWRDNTSSANPDGAFPQNGTDFMCPVDPISCPTAASQWETPSYDELVWSAEDKAAEGLRLRGLGTALHMIQDLTVPHHIAPTSGFGHKAYEKWFGHFMLPFHDRTVRVPTLGENGVKLCYCPQGSPHDDCQPSGGCEGVNKVVRPKAFEDVSNPWGFSQGTSVSPNEFISHLREALFADFSDTETPPDITIDLDTAYANIQQNMDSLAVTSGATCGAFAMRRLAWAVAYQTGVTVEQAGLDDPMVKGIAQNGDLQRKSTFWAASVLGSETDREESLLMPETGSIPQAEFKDLEDTGETSLGPYAWKVTAEQSVPYLAAASAHVLKAAALSAMDSSYTCDLPSDHEQGDGPVLAVNEPTCFETRYRNLRECFGLEPMEHVSSADCDQYAPIPLYGECDGTDEEYGNDHCKQIAEAISTCACKEFGQQPVESSVGLNNCAYRGLSTQYLDDLFESGKIDGGTYACQREQAEDAEWGLRCDDADGDGIPDLQDECPHEPDNTTGSGDTPPSVEISADICLIVRPEIDWRVRLNGVSTGRTEVKITAREEGGESHDYDIEVHVAPPARMDLLGAGCGAERPTLIGDTAELSYFLLDSTGDKLLAAGLMPFTFEPDDRVEAGPAIGAIFSYSQDLSLTPVSPGGVRVTSIFGDAEARLRFAQISDVDQMRIEFNGGAPENFEAVASGLTLYEIFLSIDGEETCSDGSFTAHVVEVELEPRQVCSSDGDGRIRWRREGACTLTFSLPEANGGEGLSQTYTIEVSKRRL